MHHKTPRRLLAPCLALLAAPAAAAPMSLRLNAADMLAQTHSHAVILNITATFHQLSGVFTYDPAAKTCAVNVTFMVRSLSFPNALIRDQTMSAGFLDPAQYPTQHYVATCQGDRLLGNLTMRGQTHPFNMTVTYRMTNGQITGVDTAGVLDRYQWGLDGMGFTVGKMIRVTNDIALDGQPPAAH